MAGKWVEQGCAATLVEAAERIAVIVATHKPLKDRGTKQMPAQTYIIRVAGRRHGGAGHQVVSLARLVPLLRELLLGRGVRGVRALLGLVLVAGAVDGRRQRDELVGLVRGQLHAVEALGVLRGDELRAVVARPEPAVG
jgi:hypothetical protein